MKQTYKEKILIVILFSLLASFVYRNYFLKGLVPFPANLLVSFYSPWRYESWDGYPNGPPNKPIGFDVLKLFYPFRKFTIEELEKGKIPLWNPYNFTGNVHLATYQSAVLYPLNLIFFVFPLIDAWSILVILQPILASFFSYLFLRELNLSKKSSFFGGVVFAFSGWMLGWSEESLAIEHSALWLPLMLYSVEKIFKKNWKYMFLLFISMIFSITAGFLQTTLYAFITTAVFVIFKYLKRQEKDYKPLIFILTAVIFSILASFIHLLPSFEAYFNSPRGVVGADYLFKTYLMKPWHLIAFLAPDFWGNPGAYNYFGDGFFHEKIIFIGIPALLLSIYIINLKIKNRELTFFKFFTITTLMLGFFPLGWILHFSHLPVISVMIPSRIFFLSTFGFSVLSAYGMNNVLSAQNHNKLWNKILLAISFVFIALWGFVVYQRLVDPLGNPATISFRNLIFPSLVFFICALVIKTRGFISRLFNWKKFFYGCFFFISFFSSLYFANKFLYFSERKFVFPEIPAISQLKKIAGYDRVWGYGNAYIEKNMTMYFHLYSPEGYDALYPQRYGELLFTQEKEGKITDQILRTDANIKQASEREGVLDNWYRRRLLALTGVKYILEAKVGDGKDFSTTEKRFPSESFSLVWQDDKFRIWEYKEALPRAFLVHDFVVESNKQKIADLIFDKEFDLRKRIILEEDPRLISTKTAINYAGESVEIKQYEPHKIILEVKFKEGGLLFLSDNYDSGWKSFVNGKETPVFRANYSFRAISIGAGNSMVSFIYKPVSFVIGWVISISALILFFIVLAIFFFFMHCHYERKK